MRRRRTRGSKRAKASCQVEDDATTREAIVEVLRALNYRLLMAANGHGALAALDAEAGRIDLVLSDLVMPEMGGKALFETIRSKYPSVRMVIITGYPRIRGTRELLEHSRVNWIQEPLGAKDLAEAVQEALGKDKTRPARGRFGPSRPR